MGIYNEVYNELAELRKVWWNQDFRFTSEQQKRYDELLQKRRARVKSFYENNQVFKGRSGIE